MKQLPTAEEMLKSNYLLIENDKTCEAHTHLVVKQMQEYAKLHVQAALEAAAKSAMFSHESGKGKIHYDVYPLTNIK